MKTRIFLLFPTLLFGLLAPSACSYTLNRSAETKIRTEPPGATIWRSSDNGWQKLGPAPIEVEQTYQTETAESVSGIGVPVTWSLVAALAGTGSVIYASDDRDIGIGLFSAAGTACLLALVLPLLITDDQPSEQTYSTTLSGYDDKDFKLTVPCKGEVFVSLDKSWYQRYGVKTKDELGQADSIPKLIPALGDFKREVRLEVISIFEKIPRVDQRVAQALQDTAANDKDPKVRTRAAAALRKMKFVNLATAKRDSGEKLVVAVFDVFDTTGGFGAKLTQQLTSFLTTAMVETGRFQVVPRARLRELLRDEKTDSYKKCYEESCQIELGKAVAARITLSTQLIKVGSKCMVTANIYDLKSETADKGVTVNTGCKDEDLLTALREVVSKISSL